ncbi:glycosyltransferase [Lapidilactobacillus dextrinicus]|uniref:glycosyltransferase n=1 Tax=Lapidilactobacillus dextrinicus TaxID=51664 RepID=UPI0022E5D79D|nr:glycosyltransferase [Lapidilactobacillus dextrinicus]
MNIVSVVVTYNRKELLIESINSLLAQKIKPKKIFIINNCSTDGTVDLLAKIFDFQMRTGLIELINLPQNIGGSGGFHLGLEKASKTSADFISLSDDDAIFDQNYFRNIQQYWQTHPKVAAFCGKVIDGQGRIQLVHKRNVLHSRSLLYETNISEEQYQHDFKVDVVSFVGLVVSRQLVNKIGLPLAEYFIWYDDTEYSLRIRKYSEIVCLPSSVITHKVKQVSKNKNEYHYSWKEYYGVRNKINSALRHSHHPTLTRITAVYHCCRSIIGTIIKPKFTTCRVKRVRMLINGYADGLSGKLGSNQNYQP